MTGRSSSDHPALSAASSRSSLDAWTNRRIPGGCEDCTAYQTLTRHAPGYYVLTIHHDDTCPELHRIEEQGFTS